MKARRTVISFTLLALSSTMLSACEALPWDTSACSVDNAINIAFVVGHRANAPAPQVVPDAMKIVESGIRSNGDYVTISADGEPFEYDHNYLGSDKGDGNLCMREQDKSIDEMPAQITGAKNRTSEADILKAISLGADGIRDKPGAHVILVIDNGLQTVEPLNLTRDDRLYAYTPDKFVENVIAQDGLPDLTGITVYWSGMGGTIAPQQPLTIEAQKRLTDLWRAIVEKAGGKFELISQALQPTEPAVSTTVTPVPIRAATGLPTPVVLTEDSVRFRPDLWEFAYPEIAEISLAQLAQQILSDTTGGVVTVTGVTDDFGSMEHQLDISLKRANTVVAALVRLGVPADRLKAQGLGSQWACFNPTDDNANRKVIVTTALQAPEDVCS